MQFNDILGALRRRWVFVVVPLVIVVAGAFYGVSTAPTIYQSTSQAYVSLSFGKSATDLAQGSTYAQQQLASYALVARSAAVLDPVIRELGLDTTAKKLAKDVQATASSETVIIDITVRSTSAQEAADIANAVTKKLSSQVEELSPSQESGGATVRVTEISPAVPASVPVSPNKRRDLMAGLLGGLLVGVLAALARERADTRVRDRSGVPAGTNVIGTIPFDKSVKAAGPVIGLDAKSRSRGEAYRRARTLLQFADIDSPAQVIEVTSALPSEGKSVSALNLAQVFAGTGGRVLLVDADLRKPRIAEQLGLVGTVGLVDVLIGKVRLDDVLQEALDGGLTVLPCGTIPPNPTELLASQAMASLVGVLRDRFDIVILDTPPLVSVVDAAAVAPLTDGAVIVSRRGRATRAQLASTVAALDAVGTRVLGVLMTFARERAQSRRSVYGDGGPNTALGHGSLEARVPLDATPAAELEVMVPEPEPEADVERVSAPEPVAEMWAPEPVVDVARPSAPEPVAEMWAPEPVAEVEQSATPALDVVPFPDAEAMAEEEAREPESDTAPVAEVEAVREPESDTAPVAGVEPADSALTPLAIESPVLDASESDVADYSLAHPLRSSRAPFRPPEAGPRMYSRWVVAPNAAQVDESGPTETSDDTTRTMS